MLMQQRSQAALACLHMIITPKLAGYMLIHACMHQGLPALLVGQQHDWLD